MRLPWGVAVGRRALGYVNCMGLDSMGASSVKNEVIKYILLVFFHIYLGIVVHCNEIIYLVSLFAQLCPSLVLRTQGGKQYQPR